MRKEIFNMDSSGRSVGIYRGLVYESVRRYELLDVSACNEGSVYRSLYDQQAPQVNVDFMDDNVLDLFNGQ